MVDVASRVSVVLVALKCEAYGAVVKANRLITDTKVFSRHGLRVALRIGRPAVSVPTLLFFNPVCQRA